MITNSDYEKILDSENAETEEFYIGDSEAISNTKNGVTTILWTRDHVLYTLFGSIDQADLKIIAEKIK